MNKQEAIEKIYTASWNDGYHEGLRVDVETVNKFINQIDEPQKVTVPKFVAEWIEELKKSHSNMAWVWQVYPNEAKIKKWLESNTEKFMRAWLDGYEIEQEKLYIVEIPNPHSYIDNHSRLARNYKGKVVLEVQDWLNTFDSYKLTEAEIKQDFEWAFQFAKPVEKEE